MAETRLAEARLRQPGRAKDGLHKGRGRGVCASRLACGRRFRRGKISLGLLSARPAGFDYFLVGSSMTCMSLAGVLFWAAAIRGRSAPTEIPSVPPEKPSM